MAAGLVAAAATADVESTNMVGYRTLDITKGNFNMISVTWDACGGGALDFNQLLAGPLANGLQGGSGYLGNVGDADQLRIWNPATSDYKFYYLYDSEGYASGWDGRWIEESTGVPAEEPFAKGAACWLLSNSGSGTLALLQSGQVPEAASVSFGVVSGNLNMLASPYPAPFALNGAGAPANLLALGAQGGSLHLGNVGDADQLRIWNPATSDYKFYYLYDSAGYASGWDGRWIEESTGEPTEAPLPPGTAFWYLSNGDQDFNFTFSKAY